MKYVIGDIHSNDKELKKILEILKPKKNDLCVFLGDLLDKGSNPEETIESLNNLDAKAIYLYGNHDYVWKQYLLNGDMRRKEFLQQKGGNNTLSLDVYTMQEAAIKLKLYLDIVKQMKTHVIIEDYLIIHGGLSKDQLQNRKLAIGEKNYFIRPEKMELNKKYLGKYRIIAGHTFLNTKPQFFRGYINIDTGAGYGKYLSAYSIEDKKVIRSDGKIFEDRYD